jgi:hypothetical protein
MQLHNCGATWRETVPVHELFRGQTVWQGEVEVFDLQDHPKAKRAYGNAIHDGNSVLGRAALKQGDIKKAARYLLDAGKTQGSPQLNSFGPNMSLAKELLEKGEKNAVLQYFEFCRKFWSMGGEDLDNWTKEVKAGKVPDFGANLSY